MNPAVSLLTPRNLHNLLDILVAATHHSCPSSLCPHNAGVHCAEKLNFGKFQQAFMQTQ